MDSFVKGDVYCMSGINMKGFIMSSADDDLCQTINTFGETTANTDNLAGFTFQTTILSSTVNTMNMWNSNLGIAIISQSKLYQVPNDCCLFAGITSSPFSVPDYVLDFPLQKQTYPDFTMPDSPLYPGSS